MTEIDNLIAQGAYKQALDKCDEHLNICKCPSVLIKKSILLQLTDDDLYNLNDIKNIIDEVLTLDRQNIDAMLEKAWFILSIEDNAKEAIPYFQDTILLLRKILLESYQGLVLALEDMGNKEELSLLFNNLSCFFSPEEMGKLKENIDIP